MKKIMVILCLFLLVFPLLSNSQQKDEKYENYVFRLKSCQLSRHGAKIIYYSLTGYLKIVYAPIDMINQSVFIKIDGKIPYSFVHYVLIDKVVKRITVYLPHIMAYEYSTVDLTPKEIQKVEAVKELIIIY